MNFSIDDQNESRTVPTFKASIIKLKIKLSEKLSEFFIRTVINLRVSYFWIVLLFYYVFGYEL